MNFRVGDHIVVIEDSKYGVTKIGSEGTIEQIYAAEVFIVRFDKINNKDFPQYVGEDFEIGAHTVELSSVGKSKLFEVLR